MRNLLLSIYMALIAFLPICQAQEAPHPYQLHSDIVWASPGGFDLTMDIYTPQTGKSTYPVLVVFHGGGWLINNKSIMDDMSAYVAGHGEYVVCNVNYRLLGDQENTVTMDAIIGDVFGAVLWVKGHISAYGGNPEQLIVTGDSAGGHLSACVVMMGDQLSSTGFAEAPIGFLPTYLPEGMTAEGVAAAKGLEVQAAVISYGAFDIYQSCTAGGFEQPSNIFWQLGGAKPRGIFGDNYNTDSHPERYKSVSPLYYVRDTSVLTLPPLLFTVGSEDNLTTPESVSTFVESVRAAGHEAEYWVHEGRPHAFMDSGSNPFLKINFEEDAIPALEVILSFLDEIFYPAQD